jgi:uncharacterized protein YdaU (DUF1376 family)
MGQRSKPFQQADAGGRMNDRLPWFRCYPARLLGALAALEPDEQLVYVTTLLRIYETGGPITDDDRVLARRTGLERARVAAAMARLFELGKLVQTEVVGAYINPVALEEIEASKSKIETQSEHQSKRAKARWGKAQVKQQIDDAGGIAPVLFGMPENADLDSEEEEEEEKEKKDSGVVAAATRPQIVNDPFEKFWAAYPQRKGANPRKPAKDKFERLVRDGADPNEITRAAKRYTVALAAEQKIDTVYVAQAVTWLNQERWRDDMPKPAPAQEDSPFDGKFFAPIDSTQWQAWNRYKLTHGDHRGATSAPNLPGSNGRRGWYFDDEYPPGYDPPKQRSDQQQPQPTQ